MELQQGDRFEAYTIDKQIGVGGFARVYLATDANGKTVALKILKVESQLSDEDKGRFNREVRIIRQLDHPSIIKIHDHGISEDRVPYLVMDYYEQGTLRNYIGSHSQISLKESLGILKQIAAALDYAHQKKVVHRDFKPANILVSGHANRRFILSDFGLAFEEERTRYTETMTLGIGTPAYISPEQIESYTTADYRTDLYALAVLGYLLFTGYLPFTGAGTFKYVQHTTQRPPIPSQVNPKLNKAIDRVLLTGLLKNPDKRFQSASAFIKALYRATSKDIMVQVQPDASNPVQPQLASGYTTQVNLPKQNKRNRPLWIAGASVLAIAIVLVGIMMWGIISDNQQVQATSLAVAAQQTESVATITALAWTSTPSPTWTASTTPSQTPTLTTTATYTPSSTPTVTATSTPTITPTPTSTATATYTPTPMGDAVVLPQAGLNLRGGPGGEYTLLQVLEQGTALDLLGRSADNLWYEVQTPSNRQGWVSSEYLEILITRELVITWNPTVTPTPVTEIIVVSGDQSTTNTTSGNSSSENTVIINSSNDGSSTTTQDSDGDGFADNVDSCPSTSGVSPDGCPSVSSPTFSIGAAHIGPDSIESAGCCLQHNFIYTSSVRTRLQFIIFESNTAASDGVCNAQSAPGSTVVIGVPTIHEAGNGINDWFDGYDINGYSGPYITYRVTIRDHSAYSASDIYPAGSSLFCFQKTWAWS